jgi:two-component system, OmpR family, KDP operon response regulator KdpE
LTRSIASNKGRRGTEKIGVRILLVDDEHSIQEILSLTLQPAGYILYPASTGEEALQKFKLARPELILLDLFLPDMDGKEVLRRLRAWTSTPIVVMSVRHQEADTIACLDAGADDYLTKPFTMGELLARLRAVLRRAFGASVGQSFKAGALRVDFNRREVFVGVEQVNLSATEYDLLKVLIHHAGLVRTHHQLIHELWGGTHYQDSVHLLRVTVSNLRRKLACDPRILRYIATEPGVGYRLRTDADWAQVRENL